MLTVRIKNHTLNPVVDFLYDLSLKGKESRHRTKLIKTLSNRVEEVVEHQNELLKQHCHLDEEGNPKMTNDGKNYDVIDVAAFSKDREDLYGEEVVIDGEDSQVMLTTVRGVLDDLDIEMSGQQAVLYDYLCQQFKVDEEITTETES